MDFISFNKSHTLRCLRNKFFSILSPVDVAKSQIPCWFPHLITRHCEAQQCLQKGVRCMKSCFMAAVFGMKDGWYCCPALVILLPWIHGPECLYAFGAQCLPDNDKSSGSHGYRLWGFWKILASNCLNCLVSFSEWIGPRDPGMTFSWCEDTVGYEWLMGGDRVGTSGGGFVLHDANTSGNWLPSGPLAHCLHASCSSLTFSRRSCPIMTVPCSGI